MDTLFIIGITTAICVIINIISGFFIQYKCQRAILKSQAKLEFKISSEKKYLDTLKTNLESYLMQMTKIQKKDHLTMKKLKK